MNFKFLRKIGLFLVLGTLAITLAACGGFATGDNRHNQPLSSIIQAGLRNMGSSPQAAMMVRIFKQENLLEVWKQTNAGPYKLFKTYDICAYSGDLGPKIKEGDRQSPEGFYDITPGLMNPKSSYYLSFNTGFPNKFDRSWGRTGSNLMVHGDCSSRGCYAMTDGGIAEIYALARESFKGGNRHFQLQIFPFRMNAQNLAKHASNANLPFWKNVKQGYDVFELTKTPPKWDVCEKRYIFNPQANGPLNAQGACPASERDPALVAKQSADQQAFASAVESLEQKKQREAAAVQRQADADAAAKQRGQAISGFLGGLFGGSTDQSAPTEDAPQPAPLPKR